MKKIVRLTESDLVKLINKVLKEEQGTPTLNKQPESTKGIQGCLSEHGINVTIPEACTSTISKSSSEVYFDFSKLFTKLLSK